MPRFPTTIMEIVVKMQKTTVGFNIIVATELILMHIFIRNC